MKSVAVIGAGGAGLAMARYLGAHPNLFKFVVYEQSSDVGGTWTYDSSVENLYDDKSKRNGHKELTELIAKDGIHSSMYKGLRYVGGFLLCFLIRDNKRSVWEFFWQFLTSSRQMQGRS